MPARLPLHDSNDKLKRSPASVIGIAALGAAVYVLRTPALRRVVWGAARNALIAGVPAWLLAETRSGWAESAGGPDSPRYDRRVSSTSSAGDIAAWCRDATAGRRRPHAAAVSPQQAPPHIPPRRKEIRLTLLAIWRGVVGVYNSDDLTFASSIAYYALLSLFPFFCCCCPDRSASTAATSRPRTRCSSFVLRYFPRQFEFVTSQLDALQQARVRTRRRRQHPDDLGGDGRVRRDHLGGQPRVGRREAAELLQAQADLVHDAGRCRPAAARGAAAGQRDQRRRSAAGSRPSLERHRALRILRSFAVAGRARSRSSSSSAWSSISCRTPRSGSATSGSARSSPGCAWRGALVGFSWYVAGHDAVQQVHGSIAAVVVFLIWVYISAVMLLYGVEVTAANARLRRHRPEEIPAAPSPRI